ncbi:hypothetical protein GIB67_039281 [Kingdonia uniflora]|uniref:Potassium channel domain-containing protein n=1 Tax=Kingdonia uniflora TaxID=39325 RepID=A0A7J7MMC5_9MAGN|nr:hypothetical protein GIB67_039281 [Kingdonia uniflora]
MKVGLALGVVISCIGTGILVLYSVEGLNLVYSIYLSVMPVTTVGYGDRAFHTLYGRLFASVWLLFSTLVVARAFLYLAESRIDKRHRRITLQWYRLSDHNDTAGVSGDGVASIRSKVYLSPKLWYLRVNVIEAQDLHLSESRKRGRFPEVYVKAFLGNNALRAKVSLSRNANPSRCETRT